MALKIKGGEKLATLETLNAFDLPMSCLDYHQNN